MLYFANNIIIQKVALILNIETSTKACSVALAKEGKIIASKEYNGDNYSHSKLLTVFIEDIFKETKIDIKTIDAVSVSKGPGSYTGLRIGVSAAKGISYALNIPLLSVSTLKHMALGVSKDINFKNRGKNIIFAPMIDARRMEVYTALYNINNDKIKEIKAEIIDENTFSDFLENNKIINFGDGSEKCKNIITHKNAIFIDKIFPSATNMISISETLFNHQEFQDTAYFEPYYLKDFIATVPKKHIYG